MSVILVQTAFKFGVGGSGMLSLKMSPIDVIVYMCYLYGPLLWTDLTFC